jgi:hypothetical protein
MLLWQKLTCFQIPKRRNHFGNTAFFMRWGGTKRDRDEESEKKKRHSKYYTFISNPLFLIGWIQMQIGFFSSSPTPLDLLDSRFVVVFGQIDSILSLSVSSFFLYHISYIYDRVRLSTSTQTQTQLDTDITPATNFFKQFEMSRALTWQMRWSKRRRFLHSARICDFIFKTY